MSKQYTKYDQEMMEIFRDPVKWAQHHLGDTPRWYQEQILRHPHHRKVLRCGRRIGKCIDGEQRILNPNTGEYKTINELYENQDEYNNHELITLNEKYQLEPSEAFFIEDNGVKESFKVKTKFGAEVTLTGNHPVLTLDGWVEVDALKVGQRIATPKALPYFGTNKIAVDRLKVIAYLLAGGHYNGKQFTFSCKSEVVLDDFREAADSIGMKTIKQVHKENTCAISQHHFPDTFIDDVVVEKKVPNNIFSLSREQASLFLNCLYAVNGWAYSGNRPEIGYATTSKNLAKDIKHLLLRFGIQSNLKQKKTKYKGKVSYINQLLIHRQEALLLFTYDIGIIGKDNAIDDVEKRAKEIEMTEHTVPKEVWNYIEEERKEKNYSRAKVAGGRNERLRTGTAPSISKIATYADNLESAFLYDLARADVIWEEVVEIEEMGERQTYDVFVPETHNLVVEDVLVHNTWTMCAHMLWVAFTCNGGTEVKDGAICVVATPYDTQARLIFDQLNTFIDNNPVLKSSVETITKNPYYIKFKNKSAIKLFTAGTRSGSEGGSLRGQAASWIYMDKLKATIVPYMSNHVRITR